MHPPFPRALIQSLEPSDQKLLTMLCEQLSDEAIHIIARADYGYGADSNFIELKQQISGRTFPSAISFGVHEVLRLTRWLNATANDELLARCYSCVQLLHLKPEHVYDEASEPSSLITLVDSAIKLPEYSGAIMQFTAWRALHCYDTELAFCRAHGDDESDVFVEPYTLLALLLLMILNGERKEDQLAVYNELTGHKETAEEKAAVIDALVQDSGVNLPMWRDLVSRLALPLRHA